MPSISSRSMRRPPTCIHPSSCGPRRDLVADRVEGAIVEVDDVRCPFGEGLEHRERRAGRRATPQTTITPRAGRRGAGASRAAGGGGRAGAGRDRREPAGVVEGQRRPSQSEAAHTATAASPCGAATSPTCWLPTTSTSTSAVAGSRPPRCFAARVAPRSTPSRRGDGHPVLWSQGRFAERAAVADRVDDAGAGAVQHVNQERVRLGRQVVTVVCMGAGQLLGVDRGPAHEHAGDLAVGNHGAVDRPSRDGPSVGSDGQIHPGRVRSSAEQRAASGQACTRSVATSSWRLPRTTIKRSLRASARRRRLLCRALLDGRLLGRCLLRRGRLLGGGLLGAAPLRGDTPVDLIVQPLGTLGNDHLVAADELVLLLGPARLGGRDLAAARSPRRSARAAPPADVRRA